MSLVVMTAFATVDLSTDRYAQALERLQKEGPLLQIGERTILDRDSDIGVEFQIMVKGFGIA